MGFTPINGKFILQFKVVSKNYGVQLILYYYIVQLNCDQQLKTIIYFAKYFIENKPREGVLNAGQEDEMKITGYRRSLGRVILCWICICLTAGFLRLLLHWWKHWYLFATHCTCSLEEADTVLIEENYKGQHKCYYIKPVQYLDYSTLK